MSDFPNSWMWSEACDMLVRAERMHREFFRPARRRTGFRPGSRRSTCWRPSATVLVFVALPGVDPDRVEAAIDGRRPGGGRQRACCRASCGPRPSIVWSCRKAASSGASGCRPAATPSSAGRWRMAAF